MEIRIFNETFSFVKRQRSAAGSSQSDSIWSPVFVANICRYRRLVEKKRGGWGRVEKKVREADTKMRGEEKIYTLVTNWFLE